MQDRYMILVMVMVAAKQLRSTEGNMVVHDQIIGVASTLCRSKMIVLASFLGTTFRCSNIAEQPERLARIVDSDIRVDRVIRLGHRLRVPLATQVPLSAWFELNKELMHSVHCGVQR